MKSYIENKYNCGLPFYIKGGGRAESSVSLFGGEVEKLFEHNNKKPG